MRKKNVSQDNQLQEFITKIIKLNNESVSSKIEKITRKKNVSQNNQLQEFISKTIELKNES